MFEMNTTDCDNELDKNLTNLNFCEKFDEDGNGHEHGMGLLCITTNNINYQNNLSSPLIPTLPSNNPNPTFTSITTSSFTPIPKTKHLVDPKKVEAMSPPSAVCSDDLQLDFDDMTQPLSERWSPLGANYDDAISPSSDLLSPESELELLISDSHDKLETPHTGPVELTRIRNMEDEQELLTSSLLALTSHFAHVQLRVRQIVEAPSHERDQLLKDLEEFAFRGIPEPISLVSASNTADTSILFNDSTLSHHTKAEYVEKRQFELIEHLKTQLSELEKVAYESGAPVLPQHILLEKQKIIIDELKSKLNLKVKEQDLPELSAEELRGQVDNAIGEFVGPLKMKDQLVAQLKTQITDLERFIAFLQCDSDDSKMKTLSSSEKFNEAYNSYAAKKKATTSRKLLSSTTVAVLDTSTAATCIEADDVGSLNSTAYGSTTAAHLLSRGQVGGVRESLNIKAHGLMDKASLLMQMFATTHFGTKSDHFQKNTLKKTSKGNHWGDLRAQLEVDIQEVASLAATLSFDREKLANMKCSLNTKANFFAVAASTAHNGNTVAQHGGRCRPMHGAHHNELKPYTLSSDSDDEYNACDCYNWEKNGRHSLRYRGDSISTINKELSTAVRKNFAMTLLRLIQHELRVESDSATSSFIVPFMRCLNPSPVFAAEQSYFRHQHTRESAATASSFAAFASSAANYSVCEADEIDKGTIGGTRQMHAWELIMEYYYLKHGDEYNNTPAQKLSQSFNLDISDSQAVSTKESLLSTVGTIIAMHRPYKRSYNAHFKAFVCAALNSHQLVAWLNLLFSCNDLIDTYYTSSSYVVRTGFRDSLRSIDALTKYEFDLPVDLAVRHFRNI